MDSHMKSLSIKKSNLPSSMQTGMLGKHSWVEAHWTRATGRLYQGNMAMKVDPLFIDRVPTL